MKDMGFGVLLNDEPFGYWPRSWVSACNRVALAQQREIEQAKPKGVYTIVPIMIGNPITPGPGSIKKEAA